MQKFRLLRVSFFATIVAAIDIGPARPDPPPSVDSKVSSVDVLQVSVNGQGQVLRPEDTESQQHVTMMRSEDKPPAALLDEEVDYEHPGGHVLSAAFAHGRKVMDMVPPGTGQMLSEMQDQVQGHGNVRQLPIQGPIAAAYPADRAPGPLPSPHDLNRRPCPIPLWASGEVLCKEATRKARSRYVYTALDQLGQQQTMMRDGGVCTAQCSEAMWWQRPITSNITCSRGYWVDQSGRDIDEMKCRTAPHIWATLGACIAVIFVFVWIFVYYQPGAKGGNPPERAGVLAPTHPPHVASSLYVIRD